MDSALNGSFLPYIAQDIAEYHEVYPLLSYVNLSQRFHLAAGESRSS